MASSRSHHLLLLLLLLSIRISSAQSNYRNMTAGTTLSPLVKPTSWLSPSGDFAFGFLPHPANSSLFLLTVWYNLLLPNNNTIVWWANGDTPVPAASTATLKSNGQFSLADPSGQEIWNPGTSNISHVSVLDTGNLVFSASDSAVLWQSFDHPTDTILPGQVLSHDGTVSSKLMDTDYSTSRFKLRMQTDGNLVMYRVAYQTPDTLYDSYWSTATFGSGFRLVYNESGSIYLTYSNNSLIRTLITTAVPSDHYHRGTLDPDGIFRQYSVPKNKPTTGNWMVEQTLGSNVCTGYTASTGSGCCGFNSYCSMDPDGRVDCACPPHYSFLDPDRKYKGCEPDFVAQSCEPGGEASFYFEAVTNLNWPGSDADHFSPMNQTECRSNCLKDCSCAVAIYNNGSCWKKKFPLSNGVMSASVDALSLIKYSRARSSSVQTDEVKRYWKIWAVAATLLIGSSVLLNVVQFGACLRSNRTLRRKSSDMAGPALCSFTYKELEEATDGFSEELGRGAFSTVFKGTIASDPRIPIAVKRLESMVEMEEAEKDFMDKIHTVGLTHHKNLVRLLGFCKEGKHRLLVYECMSNGSLNKILFGSDAPDWNQRIQIALGIASGLAYLHEDCRTQIIHYNIKPQNILLDDNLVARISDFGMVKLLRLQQTQTSTGIRGTIGYFVPEWFKNSAITAKVGAHSFGLLLLETICCRRKLNCEYGFLSEVRPTLIDRTKEDVYSFGVLLLEIICRRRNLKWEYAFLSEARPTLTDLTKECFRNGRLDLLVVEDEEAKKDTVRLERFVMVAISCIQEEPSLRPSMKKVVQMLEGTIEVAIPPSMSSLRLQ